MKNSVIIIFVILLFSGCGLSKTGSVIASDKKIPSMEPFQIKAIKCEKKDDLQLALANWRIAERLMIEKINALTEHIDNNAEKHFQKGLTLYNSGFYSLASIQFIKTLSYDREHKEALRYLKKDGLLLRSRIYEVTEGDTFASVASKVYKNKNRGYIVKYFSGCSADSDLKKGLKIELPLLEVGFTKLFFNSTKELRAARKAFRKKDYEQLLVCSDKILRHDPKNTEALYMKNTACFNLGKKYYHNGKYQQAITLLNRVDRIYRNVKNEIEEIKKTMQRKKNETVENLNNSLYHKGLRLYKEKDYLNSLKILCRIEKGYANVSEIIEKIKTEMKKVSELHYKNGVRFFVNEELKGAVNEWKTALSLDPDNKKIRRDIENAMNLLEKIGQIH